MRSENDKLADSAFAALLNGRGPTVRRIDELCGRTPAKANVLRIREVAAPIKKYATIVAFMDAILNGDYKDWRYRYGGPALGPTELSLCGYGRVSVARKAFSLMRQSLRYGRSHR